MKLTTFILLADPQVGNLGVSQQEMKALSTLNGALNKISTVKYPVTDPTKNISLSCTGLIAKPDAVFFAGDMTNWAGLMDMTSILEWLDPAGANAATYQGGPQLRAVRSLYDPKYPTAGITQLSDCGPLYFGLGNHDLFDYEHDLPAWRDYEGNGVTKPVDYYRYQMWNFISQMHTGYHRNLHGSPVNTAPRYPIGPENIDSDPKGSYFFQNYSLNYKVDLGPVDVYQLHLFGGNTNHTRKSGLNWLKRKLAAGGYTRPVIVVQHLPVTDLGGQPDKDYWTVADRDALLSILRPYNVLAVAVGHLHSPANEAEVKLTSPIDGVRNDHHMYEIRQGSASPDPGHPDDFDKKTATRFAVVRVEESASGEQVTLDAAYGTIKLGETQVGWNRAWTNTTAKTEMYVRDIKVVDLPQDADDATVDLPWYVTEEGDKSANINAGFGGRSVYLVPLLTSNAAEALTGFDLVIQDAASSNSSWKDVAVGAAGPHRYLVAKREACKAPVRQLFLWRADGKTAPRLGWETVGDINRGRGGDALYLEWQAGSSA